MAMRNPNGYGGVITLAGKRRKPYAARITDGFDKDGKQKYKYLGTFEKRIDANTALSDYNKNPYDIEKKKITFKKLYELFYERKFKGTTEEEKTASKNAYKQGFNLSKEIHNDKFVDIKTIHLQDIIDDCGLGDSSKANIVKTWNQMYKFAMEHDITEKNYAQFVQIVKEGRQKDRIPFSDEEIKILWDHIDTIDDIDTILIMIYTSLRPGEIIDLKSQNVHLNKRYLIGGFKTDAGKDRVIPIHKKIHRLIEHRVSLNNKFLISGKKNNKISYTYYRTVIWNPIMEKLNMNHRPHDSRHTFATMMDNIDVNRTSIKKIMGHSSGDITEKIYTHKNIEQLIKAIDKLE